MRQHPHLSPIMSVLSGRRPGCLSAMTLAVILEGFPIRSGSRPDAADTAAIMAPVAVGGNGLELRCRVG